MNNVIDEHNLLSAIMMTFRKSPTVDGRLLTTGCCCDETRHRVAGRRRSHRPRTWSSQCGSPASREGALGRPHSTVCYHEWNVTDHGSAQKQHGMTRESACKGVGIHIGPERWDMDALEMREALKDVTSM